MEDIIEPFVHHNDCHYLLACTNRYDCCTQCSTLRKSLRTKVHRFKNIYLEASTRSHTNYRQCASTSQYFISLYLNRHQTLPTLVSRLGEVEKQYHEPKLELKEQIAANVEVNSITLDEVCLYVRILEIN